MKDKTASSRECVTMRGEPGASLGPETLTLIELEQQQLDLIGQAVPGGLANVQDVYPLSPLQEGMLFHHLLNERSETYVLSTLYELQSPDHVDALIHAVQKLIDRHDILRSAIFSAQLPSPVHVVCRNVTLPVEEIVLDRHGDVMKQLRSHSRPPHARWNLQRPPLLELHVTRDSPESLQYAILHVHHVICDHQSLRAITAELTAIVCGQGGDVQEAMPHRDFVAQMLASVQLDEAEAFFRSRLANVDEPTAPFGLLDVHGDGSRVDEAQQLLDPRLASSVRAQAQGSGTSAARLFHAAWALVVARTSGRDDVVFGTVLSAARRPERRTGRGLGMSINTLPLRLSLSGLSARELVSQVNHELQELRARVATPLAIAQRCAGTAATVPLFTSLLNFRHSALQVNDASAEATGIRLLERGEAWTNYPLAMTVDDYGDRFVVMAKTDRSVDPMRAIAFLSTALESLVEALGRNPNTPALALETLPVTELRQVTQLFSSTAAPWPAEALAHQLFEEQARSNPAVTAVTFEQQSLTYGQLNSRANQLARFLRSKGVGPDRLVAICMERSVNMVVGLLGILKAGGAYVPLDPANPPERLKHLLDDACPTVLLTQSGLRELIPETAAEIVQLDQEWSRISAESEDDLSAQSLGLNARNLAYVIYTSGSTGAPKGVMVEHRNIVNYAVHALRQFDVEHGDGSLVCTSISFDLMLTGLYPTLLAGRTVRLCREENGIPALAEELVTCRNLAPLKLTPSHLPLIEGLVLRGQAAGCVRSLVLGGEPLRSAAIRSWKTHAPGTRVFNHYGPTETTVGCLVYEIGNDDSDVLPIGRPISNVRAYVLNDTLRAAPIGVVGQIYIAGAGVARGYLNRPALTAERFVADPFSPDPAARMYKTGDLGRWRADGTIEFLGRNDHQVKIRGFRIEMGEIEAQLLRREEVKNAVVVAREDVPGEKRLVAYVVPRETASLGVESLRTQLKAVLPDYMVPSAFVTMERLPLTSNGKLDRRALPSPGLEAYATRQYEAPQGEVEAILAELWQELLHVERVGRSDNFFELGGHSLPGMKLIEQIELRLQTRMSVAAIFNFPTIQSMAEAVASVRGARSEQVENTEADVEEGVI